MSASFRLATISKSPQRFFRQRFLLLGVCARINPTYTPLRILIGRAMARPLVRGEARPLLIIRGVLIALIALGVPAFAVYSIIILPSLAQIYTRSISARAIMATEDLDGSWIQPANTTVFLFFSNTGGVNVPTDVNAKILPDTPSEPCELSTSSEEADQYMPTTSYLVRANCLTTPIILPVGPGSSLTTILISAQLPSAGVLQVALGHGSDDSDPVMTYLAMATSAFVFPGSQLIAGFRWTRIDEIGTLKWGLPSGKKSIYMAEISNLQPDAAANDTDPGVTSLLLYRNSPYVTRVLQETIDNTVLSGISTFGGFWTFLNGAFALFFGAHVLYFMFGRRPLSALGIAHIFQKGALVRRWHEDFPAIRTEGGLPGSKNAGIVAFIRDRLVDLGEDPRLSEEEVGYDVEAQKLETEMDEEEVTLVQSPVERSIADPPPRRRASETGYILDEIPLLDVDLGMAKILEGKYR
ncbi:hypothetical protein R3P38DRAFT_895868 [Favolaschia claudopus]|uniref:Uncharacterized protein n=1 Tax=Favolaschia claudopus TaxID=2862362 RepID=A0AAW0BTU6_9AGAR